MQQLVEKKVKNRVFVRMIYGWFLYRILWSVELQWGSGTWRSDDASLRGIFGRLFGWGGEGAGGDPDRPGGAAQLAPGSQRAASAVAGCGPGARPAAGAARLPAGQAVRCNSRSSTGSNPGSRLLGRQGESAAPALGHGPAARRAQLLIGLHLCLGAESSSLAKSFLCETCGGEVLKLAPAVTTRVCAEPPRRQIVPNGRPGEQRSEVWQDKVDIAVIAQK